MKLGYHCSQEVNNHKRCHETGCECLCHKTVTESEFLMATGNSTTLVFWVIQDLTLT